jgi:putative ABC transport system substrate-binding protein
MRRWAFMALLGAAAASPLAARAQQLMPVIGILSSGSPESDNTLRLSPFRQGLKEAGFVDGQNVGIEYRWARGQNDRLPALAADLVDRHVTVIVPVGGAPPALAAKAATTTIPIVFDLGDPVEFGLVASLSRPGGNITGVANMTAELAAKRLDLLHELLPTAAVVALLVNPTNQVAYESESRNLRDAALTLGLRLHILSASTAREIGAAFEALVEFRAGALVVSADPFLTSQKDQIVRLAARHAVPAIYVWREFADIGGLISYGNDFADSYRQVGVLVGKILKGAKPADLPVQQPVRLVLVINLKTAKALGLTVPMTLLGRADEVIE